MTELTAKQRGNAIHLMGSFNPQIFQPAWLAAQGLIREAESETAEIQIIHSDIVSYSVAWARIEVERDKLSIFSTPKSETPEQLRDLALGVIEVLNHTPVYTVAIQFWAHYALESQEARDRLGWTLVPPDPFQGELINPGMRALRVVGGRPTGEDPDENGLIVTIEPSNPVSPNGVYIGVVDQYEVAESSEADVGAEPAISCLKANWSASIKRASAIPAAILK